MIGRMSLERWIRSRKKPLNCARQSAQRASAACAEELGDLLFSVVNVARFLHVSAEQSLSEACEKFIRRFQKVEELANARGVDMQSAGIDALDKLWEEAKKSQA